VRQKVASRHGHEVFNPGEEIDIRLGSLFYRYLFFNWLFADLTQATTPLERQLAWQHNRKMRRYLPVYLLRWLVLAIGAFGLGHLFNQLQENSLMAIACFTVACLAVPVMAIMVVLWVFLSKPET